MTSKGALQFHEAPRDHLGKFFILKSPLQLRCLLPSGTHEITMQTCYRLGNLGCTPLMEGCHIAPVQSCVFPQIRLWILGHWQDQSLPSCLTLLYQSFPSSWPHSLKAHVLSSVQLLLWKSPFRSSNVNQNFLNLVIQACYFPTLWVHLY